MRALKISGPWSLDRIAEFLNSTVIPVRISAVSGSGWPIIVSLWYLYERETLFCATRPTSKIAKLLASQPRVGFEVAGEMPPYFGIRGQGLASLEPDFNAVLITRLIDRYLGDQKPDFRQWLLEGAGDEIAISINPLRIMSWDYRQRMAS